MRAPGQVAGDFKIGGVALEEVGCIGESRGAQAQARRVENVAGPRGVSAGRRPAPSLAEQVAERAPSIVGPDRPRRRVTLHRHHQREEGAFVSRALVGDALGHRLRALEPTGAVEVRALPAGAQLGPTVRTLRQRIRGDRQDAATPRAARGRLGFQNPEGALGRSGWLGPFRPRSGGAAVPRLPVSAVAHRAIPAAGDGTSCTSSRSRSSRDRYGRSSGRSACAARGAARPPPAARRPAARYPALRPPLLRAGPGRHGRQLHGRVAHDLDLEQALDDRALGPLDHLLEEIERLLLVLDQRIALAVAAQPDAFLEVVDRQQVVLPLLIDDAAAARSARGGASCRGRSALLALARSARCDGLAEQLVQLGRVRRPRQRARPAMRTSN